MPSIRVIKLNYSAGFAFSPARILFTLAVEISQSVRSVPDSIRPMAGGMMVYTDYHGSRTLR